MKKRIALIGASGHGKVIADIAYSNGFNDIVFYDDRWQEIGSLYGIKVVGDLAQAINDSKSFDAVYVSIGNNSIRARVQAQLHNIGPALVHPRACVSASVKLGFGTVVMPKAVLNADTVVGNGVIVNTGAVIEHDCIIQDFSHICPQAAIAGGVKVGTQSWVGLGSSVIQLKTIGDFVTVGAGSVVIRDIPDGQTVAGSPATLIKR